MVRLNTLTHLFPVKSQYCVALGGWGFSERNDLNDSWYIALHTIIDLVILFFTWNKRLNEHVVTHLKIGHATGYEGTLLG